ncbi:STAS/SEC14 domain-containing protein [Cyanobium sp. NS01]|uniref:STAS/SEC14 domain-containing protein n=1 Tax=Cyanobium sp. NS01 TaxID=261284 RepID=UPI001646EF14|nr:STAS/SEC14 domain-containing protein [Cyanobium sp. NS01]QNI71924.1 hypothetical protein CyaNS01_02830 [Cyanobium sp. NS01]
MISIDSSQAHVLSVRLEGLVEKADIQTMEKAFEAAFASQDRVNLIVDMAQWSDMTADAMAADARFEFSQLDKMARVPRMAIISTKQFMQALMSLVHALMPMVDIRMFAPEAMDAAVAFAAERPPIAPAPKPALTLIETGSPSLIAYELDGTISEDDIDTVMPVLNKMFTQQEQVDLLARIKRFHGIVPTLLTNTSLLSAKFTAIGHVRRYAIVGGPGWLGTLTQMMGSMLPISMRHFSAEQEADAWAWLKS